MAGDQLDLDALQVAAEPRQVIARGRPVIASPAESRTVPWAVSPRPALRRWIDSAACSIACGVRQQLLAGGGEHEAIRQAVEEPRADRVLQRLHPPRHGGVADLEPAGGRGQACHPAPGSETPADRPSPRSRRDLPIGPVQKCTVGLPICRLPNINVQAIVPSSAVDRDGECRCISSRACGSSPRASACASSGRCWWGSPPSASAWRGWGSWAG